MAFGPSRRARIGTPVETKSASFGSGSNRKVVHQSPGESEQSFQERCNVARNNAASRSNRVVNG